MLIATVSLGQSRAEKYLEQGRYADAANAYERYLNRHDEDATAHEKLGYAYRKLNRYRDSETHYRRAEELQGIEGESLMHYAQMLIKNGKRQEATVQVKAYLQNNPKSFIAKLMLGSMEEIDSWKVLPSSFEVFVVPGINSSYSDFAPATAKSGILFVSERNEDLVNENSAGYNSAPYLSVYMAEYADENFNQLNEVAPYLRNLNGDFHVGPISIDTNEQEIYYSKVIPSLRKKDTSHLGVFQATLHKGKRVKNETPLFINSRAYSVTHPSISRDGTTLLFASDMPGGLGGLDLYLMTRDSTGGGWSDPIPLPDNINTKLNEVFPYLYDKNTLYFSSDGLAGYGGLDLFVSKRKNGKWGTPINLKSPINSEVDDFGMTFKNQSIGYFSSDRQGGEGKDDIYRFVQIADPEDSERVPVSGVFEYKNLPKSGVELALLDEFDNVLKTSFTDEEGRFDFGQMPPNAQFKIEVVNVSADTLKESQMYLVNESGEKVLLLDRMSETAFAFTTLPKDAIADLTLLAENDAAVGDYQVFGQVYSELPRDHYAGLKLLVTDDDGNIITTVFTDSLGYYNIDGLSKDRHYNIALAENSDNLLARVFYDDGEALREVSNEQSSLFNFKNAQSIKERENVLNKVPLRGYFNYNDARVSGARLVLLDSGKNNLRATRTDGDGSFYFGLMEPGSDQRIIIPDTLATLVGLPSILLLDLEGNGAFYAKRISPNTFSFKNIKISERYGDLVSGYNVEGQIYERLPGDYNELVKIVAYDENGNIIETVLTDANGNFQFTKLSPDQNYIFKMSEEDASNLKVTFGNNDSTAFGNMADFVYQRLQNDYLTKLAQLEDQDLGQEKVAGQIYKKLPGDYGSGIKVYAMDDEGNIIDSTYTDASGNFEFKALERQENFIIRLSEAEDTELNIAFFDSKGFYDETVKLDSSNTYEYSKVLLEAANMLEDKPVLKAFVYGQVYKTLPGDYSDGSKIFAVDKDGNILDIATLDEYGRFEFHKLSPDQQYILQMDEEDNSQLQLSITNEKFEAISALEGSIKNGRVVFGMDGDQPAKAIETASVETPSTNNSVGFPGAKLPTSDLSIYYAHREWTLSQNDSASIMNLANGVRANENRLLTVESHASTEETLLSRTYSAQRSIAVARLLYESGIDLDRMYVTNWEDLNPAYDCPPGANCDSAELAKNRRTDLSVTDSNGVLSEPDYVIYYDFNEWTLPSDAFGMLNKMVTQLEENENLRVTVDTYTDFWGRYSTNLRISELRAINIRNYLAKRNIDPSRISVIWHGESAPVGESKVIYPVVIDKRKLNRRAEIRLLQSTQ